MRVYFRGGDGLMPQDFLQCQHIRIAVLIHQRRGGMAELMRGEPSAAKTCGGQVILNDLLHPAAADPAVIAAEKQRIRLLRGIVARGEIILQSGETGVIEINDALLASLSEYAHLAVEKIHIAGVHADQLRKTKSAVEKQRQDAVIPQAPVGKGDAIAVRSVGQTKSISCLPPSGAPLLYGAGCVFPQHKTLLRQESGSLFPDLDPQGIQGIFRST